MTNAFWQEPEVKEYVENKYKIIQHNTVNKAWLKENLARLEQYGDPINTARVRQRLYEFEDR